MNERPPATLREAAHRLQQLLWSEALVNLLHLAVRLDVPGLLVKARLTVQELADATGTSCAALERIVRAWKLLGVVADADGNTLKVGTLGRLIAPGGTDADRLMQNEQVYRAAFSELATVARTGESGFEHARGMSVWEYREQNPSVNESFNRLMAVESRRVAELLIAAYDFSTARCVVDVGGGSGTLLRTLLQRHASMRGILFDKQHVVTADPDAGYEVVHGDFFEHVPRGGDVYILKRVLHDWDDRPAGVILGRCREVMEPGSRLLIIELVLPESGDVDPHVVMSDLVMLVVLGAGRERSVADYIALLHGAGFAFREALTTPSPFRILVADAIDPRDP